MKKGTYSYIKSILLDYPKIDLYIAEREKELRYPHSSNDDNKGIRGSKSDYDTMGMMMITIEQDRRLSSLERNKRAIQEALEESCADTNTIIRELYMKKRPNYTMTGLVESRYIYVGRTKANLLRDNFFESVATKLNLIY